MPTTVVATPVATSTSSSLSTASGKLSNLRSLDARKLIYGGWLGLRALWRDAPTATELRVASLAIEGLTNRQIAGTLFVTKKTVESHLDRVFRKLGVRARGELQQALTATGEL